MKAAAAILTLALTITSSEAASISRRAPMESVDNYSGDLAVRLDDLKFVAVKAPTVSSEIIALRYSRPGRLTQTIGGEPLFIANFCDYIGGEQDLLGWLRRNFTTGTPISPNFNVNGVTVGHCNHYADLFNQAMMCKPGITASLVELRSLHTLSLLRQNSTMSFFDPLTGMHVTGLASLTDVTESKLRATDAFTPDGFNISSGLSIDYYLMALGYLDVVREGHENGTMMRGQNQQLVDTRLDWLLKQRVVEAPTRPSVPASIDLLPGQEIIIASRPILHDGLMSLQREASHLFQRQDGYYDEEKFWTFPPRFATGLVRQSVKPKDVIRLGLDTDFYAVEIDGACRNATVQINGQAHSTEQIGAKLVARIQPPRTIDKININGCDGPTIVDSYFLVPDRIINAMRAGAITESDLQSWRGEISIATGGPAQRTGNDVQKIGLGSRTLSLFDPADSDKAAILTVVRASGWSDTKPFQKDVAARAADYLDYAKQQWVVTGRDGAALLDFAIDLRMPANRVTIGTMAMLSSEENRLEVSYSTDGTSFRPLYRHRAGLLATSEEGTFDLNGSRFLIRFEGFRRSRLLLNERNSVSISHLFVTAE